MSSVKLALILDTPTLDFQNNYRINLFFFIYFNLNM